MNDTGHGSRRNGGPDDDDRRDAAGDGGPMDCAHLHDVAADLVFGMTSAAERAAALRHLRHCPDCRREVRELTETADELLLLAPAADPPPGFEARVFKALEPLENAPALRQPRTRRMRWPSHRTGLLLTAAALLAVAMLSVSTLVPRPGGGTATSGVRSTMAAAFVGPTGAEVGAALLMAGPRPYLTVSVTSVNARAYRVMVDRAGAPSEQVGIAPAVGGVCTWARMLPVPYAAVRAVRLVPMEGGAAYTSQLRG